MPVKVPRLEQPPHRCAFTLRADDPEGFFTGETLSGWDPKAAISVSYARSLARELGYAHPEQTKDLEGKLAAALAECDQLRAQLAGQQSQLDAIDVLASAGFQARKKPGRPAQPKEKV